RRVTVHHRLGAVRPHGHARLRGTRHPALRLLSSSSWFDTTHAPRGRPTIARPCALQSGRSDDGNGLFSAKTSWSGGFAVFFHERAAGPCEGRTGSPLLAAAPAGRPGSIRRRQATDLHGA